MPEHIHTETAVTNLYVVIGNSAGQRWDGAAFEDFAVANWGTYAIALVESPAGSYRYPYDIPVLITDNDELSLLIYRQSGGAPSVADPLLGAESVIWTGTEIPMNTLTAEEIREEIDNNSTQMQAIKDQTDKLPDSPAAVSNIPSAATIAGASRDEIERTNGPLDLLGQETEETRVKVI